MTIYSIPPLISSLITLFLLVLILIKGGKRKTPLLLGGICLTAAILHATAALLIIVTDENRALMIGRLNHIFLVYEIPLFLHFTYSFLNIKRHKLLIVSAYLFSFILMFFSQSKLYFPKALHYYFGYWVAPGPIFLIFCVVSLLNLIYCLYLLGRRLLVERDPLFHNKIKYVILGLGITFVISHLYIVPFFTESYPLGSFAFLPMLFLTYAVIKIDILDIGVVFRNILLYMLLVLCFTAAYMIIYLSLDIIFKHVPISRSIYFVILLFFLVAVTFIPLKERIENILDKIFFKEKYSYSKIIKQISQSLTSILNVKDVFNIITKTVMEAIKPDKTYSIAWDMSRESYVVCSAEGNMLGLENLELKKEDPFITLARNIKRPFNKYELEYLTEDDLNRKKFSRYFDDLKASLAIPIILKEEIMGLIILGSKKSGSIFTLRDLDLLETLGNHTAMALENSILFEKSLKNERLERELMIAKEIQMSMLPVKCPEIKGFEIAAECIPAREVGGDFYDFIKMGNGEMGFILGDVSGKGVPAALMVSASLNTFRLLSKETASPKEIMNQGNLRIFEAIKKGMYVALLYAMLNLDEKILILANAGQPYPIIYLKETSEISFIAPGGDRLPLGITTDNKYQEKILNLKKGDTIVLYTDGIVEAMNENKELFGFERLINSIYGGKDLEASSLLLKIKKDIYNFTGYTELGDDMSILILKVK